MSSTTEERVILIIGRTGNGKSSIANTLTNSDDKFKEGALSVSTTKDYQQETVVMDGMKLVIVDTIGIGDTQLTIQETLYKIADACYAVKGGLHQVLFVMGGRFSEEELVAYDILTQVIFNSDIIKYTTVVRTKFAPFRDSAICEQDRQALLKENDKTKAIIANCNKFIHVNNPSKYEDGYERTRADSRTRLLTHLRTCRTLYHPKELDELNGKIDSYQTEKQKAEAAKAQAENDLKQAKIDNAEKEKRIAEQDARIKAANEEIAKKTGGQMREKAPGIWEIIGGVLTDLIKPCSIM